MANIPDVKTESFNHYHMLEYAIISADLLFNN